MAQATDLGKPAKAVKSAKLVLTENLAKPVSQASLNRKTGQAGLLVVEYRFVVFHAFYLRLMLHLLLCFSVAFPKCLRIHHQLACVNSVWALSVLGIVGT